MSKIIKAKKRNFLILGLIVFALLCAPGYKDIAANVSKAANAPVIVLDPGHGGIDGGAESSDGTGEKDINLSIALSLKEVLEEKGIKVVITRDEDKGLYDQGSNGAIRSLKTMDMKERKRIIDESGADLTVSIHLNSFTQDRSVKGAQVFYPSYGDDRLIKKSERAAKIIQKKLNEDINRDNPRTELAKGDVYLLENVTCPTVIVECGFLSNDEEAQSLKKPRYQAKIADVLSESLCEYSFKKVGKN